MRRRALRWNTRPAQVSGASRPRRARYTFADVSAGIDGGFQLGWTCGNLDGRKAAITEVVAAAEDVTCLPPPDEEASFAAEVAAYLRGVSEGGRRG